MNGEEEEEVEEEEEDEEVEEDEEGRALVAVLCRQRLPMPLPTSMPPMRLPPTKLFIVVSASTCLLGPPRSSSSTKITTITRKRSEIAPCSANFITQLFTHLHASVEHWN